MRRTIETTAGAGRRAMRDSQSALLRRIIETQRDVTAGLDLEGVMGTICERTQELTGAEAGTILLCEDGGLIHAAATGFLSDQIGLPVPMEGTLSGWAYREGRSVVTNDTRTGPGASPLAYERGMRSMLVVPLRHSDETVGILIVASQRREAFSPEDLETLELLAVVLSSAMSNAAAFHAREELLAEQQRQVERLQQVDRLKDEFIALVSHELRTPLTSIRGYLELVLEDQLEPQQREFLEVIDRNSQRLLRLVGDLLFVAQHEAGHLSLDLQRLGLDGVLRDCVVAAKPAADAKQVELQLDVAGPLELEGDRSRLGQLLDNLVSNALKFTPAGGSVTLRAEAVAGQAVVEVSDTGRGIPAHEQGRLFERFFRTASANVEAVQGTGLGLTIARAIAEAHSGTIGFESVEGEGTTFTVALPLAA